MEDHDFVGRIGILGPINAVVFVVGAPKLIHGLYFLFEGVEAAHLFLILALACWLQSILSFHGFT